MLYWFHLNAYILKMYALYIVQCKWLLRSKLALFVIVDSYLILNKNNRQFLKKFWIRRNFISVQSVVNVSNKSSKNRFRLNVNGLEWSEHCLTSGIFFTLPPSNCRIVEFSFLLNWIFLQKSVFLSLNRSFPIESLEIFSIVWNIDTLRHHIVFVNKKIASLFVPFFDSLRCRNMYNVHKFGLCGYFFFIQPILSLPYLCFCSYFSSINQ